MFNYHRCAVKKKNWWWCCVCHCSLPSLFGDDHLRGVLMEFDPQIPVA